MSGYLDRLVERATGTGLRAVIPAPRRDAHRATNEFEAVTSLEMQIPPAPTIPARQLVRDQMAQPDEAIRPDTLEIAPRAPISPAAPPVREEPSPRYRRRAAKASPLQPEVARRIEVTEPHVVEVASARSVPEERETKSVEKLEPPPTSREPIRAPRAEKSTPPPLVPKSPERKQTTTRTFESRVERIEPARMAGPPVAIEPVAVRPEEPRLVIGRLDVEVISHVPATSSVREVVRVVERRGLRRQTGSALSSSRLGYGLEQI